MNAAKNSHQAGKRRVQTAPPRPARPTQPARKKFNLRGCLIESAIAVVAFNIIAFLVAWYFLRHMHP